MALQPASDCGCTDPEAVNFSPEASTDDGTCCYVAGCMQETAINYDPAACLGDGSCIAPILGCTDELSEYYDAEANTEIALGGPLSTAALGGGGFHYNDSWDMLFSVSEPTVLTSVDVQADVAFSIDVYVKDAAGSTLFQQASTLCRDGIRCSWGWKPQWIRVCHRHRGDQRRSCSATMRCRLEPSRLPWPIA